MSISLNMTAGNDNQIIWFVEATLLNSSGVQTIWRLASEAKSLTNTWSKIEHNTLADIEESMELSRGGNTSYVSSTQLTFPRDSSDAILSGYVDSFQPATGGYYILSQSVRVGIGWAGITADSQITWLDAFYFDDQETNFYNMTIPMRHESELDGAILPPYTVQKDDATKDVSYYPNAPEANIGKIIPILLGDFGNADPTETEWATKAVKINKAPTIITDPDSVQCLVACHKCYALVDTTYYIYKYLDNYDDYVKIYNNHNGSVIGTNNVASANIKMKPDENLLAGFMVIPLDQAGSYSSGTTDKGNVFDGDTSTYGVLAHSGVRGRLLTKMSKTIDSASEFLIGGLEFHFYGAFADEELNYIDGLGAASGNSEEVTTLGNYYITLSAFAGDKISELSAHEYGLVNNTADGVLIENPQDFHWYYSYLKVTNINVLGVLWHSGRPKSNSYFINLYWDQIDRLARGRI